MLLSRECRKKIMLACGSDSDSCERGTELRCGFVPLASHRGWERGSHPGAERNLLALQPLRGRQARQDFRCHGDLHRQMASQALSSEQKFIPTRNGCLRRLGNFSHCGLPFWYHILIVTHMRTRVHPLSDRCTELPFRTSETVRLCLQARPRGLGLLP